MRPQDYASVSRQDFLNALKNVFSAKQFSVAISNGPFIGHIYKDCSFRSFVGHQLIIAIDDSHDLVMQLLDCVFYVHATTTEAGMTTAYAIRYGEESVTISETALF